MNPLKVKNLMLQAEKANSEGLILRECISVLSVKTSPFSFLILLIWFFSLFFLMSLVSSAQLSSVAQLCLTLCNPMHCSTPGFRVHHQLPELAQTHVRRVGDAIQPSLLCCLFLLLPSIFPSIRVFSKESVLPIRWPKYWSFSFSIGPSNEYSGLISFRMDWLDILAVQGTL